MLAKLIAATSEKKNLKSHLLRNKIQKFVQNQLIKLGKQIVNKCLRQIEPINSYSGLLESTSKTCSKVLAIVLTYIG